MSGTPEDQKQRVVAYYQATNQDSYLANWSGAALSFHYGLSDETTKSLDEAHLKSNAFLADALAMKPGQRVLDAGCGVGGTSLWLVENRGVTTTGLTLDPQQVALARKFAAERKLSDRATFEAMDYMALTFDDDAFDVVFNLESVCHCTALLEYFQGIRRVLKPGGPYGCLDFFVGQGQPELVKEVMDAWAMPNWQSMKVVEDAVRAAGFEDVTAVDMTPQVARSAEQMIAMARNSIFINKLQRAIDAKERPIMDAHVRGAIACSEGLLGGGVTYGYISGRRPRP